MLNSISHLSVSTYDGILPHSNVSNTNAAHSSFQAAGPPSTGASSCSARVLVVGSSSISSGRGEVLPLPSGTVVVDGGAMGTSSVLLIAKVEGNDIDNDE
jgi:hypothetical protein